MKLATQIRPISYLKAHASEIVRDLGARGPSMVITQNGEAKADIHANIAEQDGVVRADRVLDGIRDVLSKLGSFPGRGEYPPELVSLGIHEFRQIHYKPCRMIYRWADDAVYVMVAADGRRDMQLLLQRRLLA